MMQYKKILALTLAGTMAMGSSVMAFAADEGGSATGEGETQYVATSDVFDVVLPTIAEDATTFDYLLDPDGLIAKTNGDRYTGKAFDDGKTVYFLRSTKVDGTVGGTAGTGNCDYTDKSDEIKVTNKSTQAVDLTVTAKVAAVDGIKIAENSNFTNSEGTTSTDAELYLALVGTDGTTPREIAITADGVDLTASIPADENAYTVKWVTGTDGKGEYKRELTDAAKAAGYAGFKSYSFQLTGKCNTGDGIDWSGLTENAPKVDLVWSVKDFTVTAPTTITGTKIINGSGKQVYNTSAALATRLQTGSVQFLFDNVTNDVSQLTVSKIVVDGTEYDASKITVTSNTTADASSDGKLYQLTGFTATTANEVEVYYGNSILVKYTLN